MDSVRMLQEINTGVWAYRHELDEVFVSLNWSTENQHQSELRNIKKLAAG